ncbi:hypothetical protein BofuT4_P080490.1 [Botrytis cinerea T4]|uniref:Uncharacterized protein n=1 Tax=Botryotinia fuckeliana (strain T4) TaxID=999810 RepID=G2YKV6_BOTF4|nr:hypothetical protein BofuT4_P080490.1 [Botrytis cinerea T4]
MKILPRTDHSPSLYSSLFPPKFFFFFIDNTSKNHFFSKRPSSVFSTRATDSNRDDESSLETLE